VAPQSSRITGRWVRRGQAASFTDHPGSKRGYAHHGLPSQRLARPVRRGRGQRDPGTMADDTRAWHYLGARFSDLTQFEEMPIGKLPLTGPQRRRLARKHARALHRAPGSPLPVTALQQQASQARSVALRAATARSQPVTLSWSQRARKTLGGGR
jgi:hypothetical protein